MAKKGTSFRLSEEGLELINDLSEKFGISQADSTAASTPSSPSSGGNSV